MDVIPIDALRGAVAARRSWMERTLRDIVAIPSISGSEQAVQAHMRALLAELLQRGAAVCSITAQRGLLTAQRGLLTAQRGLLTAQRGLLT